MTATRVDGDDMTYEPIGTYQPWATTRDWHKVAEELKEQVRQLQLDNVRLQEVIKEVPVEAIGEIVHEKYGGHRASYEGPWKPVVIWLAKFRGVPGGTDAS